MKQKHFLILLTTLIILCAAVTIAHLLYDAIGYQHASIIYFIAKEWW